MRLPLSKVYRAFRELDEFSDEQCRGYVRRAKRRHLISMILSGLLAAVASVFVGFWVLAAVAVWSGPLRESRVEMWLVAHWLDGLIETLCVVTPLVPVLVIWLFARDIWLRYAVGKELTGSRCPACEYQLLGLTAEEGRVRCPECGNRTRVGLLGLSPEDLAIVKHVQVAAHPPLASPVRR